MTIKMNSKKNERENLSPTRRLIESEVPKNYHKFSFIFFLLFSLFAHVFFIISGLTPRRCSFLLIISRILHGFWILFILFPRNNPFDIQVVHYRIDIYTINVRHHQKLNNAVCIIFLLSRNVFMLLNAIYHKSLGAAAKK